MSEIESLISKYNIDPQNAKLKSYYSSDNIWRILGAERDENSHSAFLKWVLGIVCDNSVSPFSQFLNILVNNAKPGQIDQELKKAILLNCLKIRAVDISTEKQIPDISKIRYTDRLDLYIQCEISGVECTNLEIFIENKITSDEGKSKKNTQTKQVSSPTKEELIYSKLAQTKKYYYACNHDDGNRKSEDNTLQLYVFITPKMDITPEDEHYIKITYQDIVDYILEPQLMRADIDDHTVFLIKEYLRTLANPLNNNNIEMATTQEERSLLQDFFERNKDLFLRAAKIAQEDADTEEEREALGSLVSSLKTSTRAKNRFFTINGSGNYRMYEVIAEFVKFRNKAGLDLSDIDDELRKATKEKRRVVSYVESGEEGVYRNEVHYHQATLENGTMFYVTKELGMGKPDYNFDGIFKAINRDYTKEFRLEQV